jgi:pentose-5-phosphate-3-epimerase
MELSMPVVCPTVLADTKEEYERQMTVVANLAHRVQIDLTDRQFTSQTTIKPEDAWWPVGVKADFHLMYKNPEPAFREVLKHRPNLVIIHAEADGDFETFTTVCKSYGAKVGVALLQQTPVDTILPALNLLDHVLIFSGDLGHFGGTADTAFLGKVAELKNAKPELEIGWDGGINDQNIAELSMGGVDVLNVGGYIQNAENPHHAYAILERIAEEAGTT